MGNDVSIDAGSAFAPAKTRTRSRKYKRPRLRSEFEDRCVTGAWDRANRVVCDVSICIANWNCRDYLRRCLQSLNDTHLSVEIIVVDNASNDGAADMVEREFPRVMLIRNESNFGFARANNQAAAVANGRYFFFLNNDTEVTPGALKRMVDFLERHPHVGIVGPMLYDGTGKIQRSHRTRPTMGHFLHKTYLLRWTGLFRRSYRKCRRQAFDPMRVQPVDVLMGAAMMIPRRRFIEAGGWNEQFTFGGEDIDLSLRVGKDADVVYFPEAEVTHFGRVSTRQNLSFAAPAIALGFLRYLRSQGYSAMTVLLYKTIMTMDAPFQILWKTLEYGWRRIWRRPRKAAQSLSVVKAQWHFLTRGLMGFWKN